LSSGNTLPVNSYSLLTCDMSILLSAAECGNYFKPFPVT